MLKLALAVLGVALVATGVGLIFLPAAPIVVGVGLLVAAREAPVPEPTA